MAWLRAVRETWRDPAVGVVCVERVDGLQRIQPRAQASRMLTQRIELRALHLLQLAVHHAQAEVVAQRAFVARKKVPVQRVVRAGALTHLELLVVVAAAPTIPSSR